MTGHAYTYILLEGGLLMDKFECTELKFTLDELETMKEVDSLPLDTVKGYELSVGSHRRY